jgi:precorrin-2 dehydrogenase/sirohydrochlorin ferrochelatase
MHTYPVFLDLKGKTCLVVGAGEVGRRKILRLLESRPGRLIILDPWIAPELAADLQQNEKVTILRRDFRPEDLDNVFLVFASSSDQDLNAWISSLCAQQNILCNIVDQPGYCSFIVPSMHTQGELTIAVSTGGASPALAKKIRQDLAERFGPEYALWLKLLRRLRTCILEQGRPSEENKPLFQDLTDETILAAIAVRDAVKLEELLKQKLPEMLHPSIKDVTHDLFDPL